MNLSNLIDCCLMNRIPNFALDGSTFDKTVTSSRIHGMKVNRWPVGPLDIKTDLNQTVRVLQIYKLCVLIGAKILNYQEHNFCNIKLHRIIDLPSPRTKTCHYLSSCGHLRIIVNPFIASSSFLLKCSMFLIKCSR